MKLAHCPHCGGSLEQLKAKPKKVRRVHYINRFGKPVYRSRRMQIIMDARARGELKLPASSDWLPRYLAFAAEGRKLESRLMRVRYNGVAYTKTEAALKDLRHAIWG